MKTAEELLKALLENVLCPTPRRQIEWPFIEGTTLGHVEPELEAELLAWAEQNNIKGYVAK